MIVPNRVGTILTLMARKKINTSAMTGQFLVRSDGRRRELVGSPQKRGQWANFEIYIPS